MDSIRLGMLTPSSNTVVEPVTQAIVAPLEGVTVHFSRFEVTEISLTDTALAQFEMSPFMSAAQLLADARMHVIAWNGTSAAWRGFHEDNLLCDAIAKRFATPATASMLVLNELLAATDSKRFGLVTPYIDDVQSKIIANYEASGFHCVSERHLGIKVNFDFAAITPDAIREMVLGAAAAKPEAIIIVCTNLNAAPLVRSLEEETGIPIYDSTSAVVWRALRLAGVDTRALSAWGSLFTNPRLNV